MPHSAINTELVDFVLPVAEMPKKLLEYARKALPRFVAMRAPRETEGEALDQIFSLIRGRTGHDFSHYKLSTVRRRIERRIALHHLDGVKRYLSYLRANAGRNRPPVQGALDRRHGLFSRRRGLGRARGGAASPARRQARRLRLARVGARLLDG